MERRKTIEKLDFLEDTGIKRWSGVPTVFLSQTLQRSKSFVAYEALFPGDLTDPIFTHCLPYPLLSGHIYLLAVLGRASTRRLCTLARYL